MVPPPKCNHENTPDGKIRNVPDMPLYLTHPLCETGHIMNKNPTEVVRILGRSGEIVPVSSFSGLIQGCPRASKLEFLRLDDCP